MYKVPAFTAPAHASPDRRTLRISKNINDPIISTYQGHLLFIRPNSFPVIVSIQRENNFIVLIFSEFIFFDLKRKYQYMEKCHFLSQQRRI